MFGHDICAEESLEFITGTTLLEVLSDIDCSKPCENSEFLWKNRFLLINCSENNCDIFWNCMRVYDKHGVNVFNLYIDLLERSFGDFSDGGTHWNKFEQGVRRNGYEEFCSRLNGLIQTMHFFGITNYDNISFEEYIQIQKNARQICQTYYQEENELAETKREQGHKDAINNFFNYDTFVEQEYTKYLERCTTGCTDGADISIDEAMLLAKTRSDEVYIVVFKKNNKIVYIGKTEHLFSYLATKEKQLSADSVSFEAVDGMYVDDVLIGVKIFYDIGVEDLRVTKCNRRYGMLKKACYAYQRQEEINKKRIMHIINVCKMRVIETSVGQIINKIELEKNLH